MKHKCIISRLNEPHIARVYVLDLDQNLINNIRVLCTKSPETVKYFVPKELFLELRNGYPVPMKAECFDRKGRRLMPVDPLMALSGQLRDMPGAIPDPEELEIRLFVEGYTLPDPGEEAGFLKRTPRRDPWLAANKPTGSGSPSSAKAHRPSYSDGSSYGTAHGASGGRTSYGDAYGASASEPAYRHEPVRRATVITAIAAVVLILAAAGFWRMKDASVRRFGEALHESKYREAVMIYNGKILGHPAREAKADPQVETAVDAIKADYLSEILGYEEARDDLSVLTGIGKSGLSELAKSALGEIEVYGRAAELYMEGLESIRSGDYVNAIRVFSALQGGGKPFGTVQEASASFDTAQEAEPSFETAQETEPLPDPAEEIATALEGPYKDSEDQLALCVDRLVKSCVGIRTEEEYPDAAAKIEAALRYLPGDLQLTEARDECRSRYEQLVIQNAVSEAERKIAEGDYAGAFEVMAAAGEKVPESGRLEEKIEEYRQAFVAYITREACGRVDEGDIDSAAELIEESLRLLECEEFTELLAQVQDADDRTEPETREFYAERSPETKYSGTVRKKGQKDLYEVKAEAGGPHRILLSKVTAGLAVRMTVYAEDGSEIYNSGVVGSESKNSGSSGTESGGKSGDSSNSAGTVSGRKGGDSGGKSGSSDSGAADGGSGSKSGSSDPGAADGGSGNKSGEVSESGNKSSGTSESGSGAGGGSSAQETGATAGDSTTCRLEEGRTYTVEIEAVGGKGSYILTVRHQKPAYDITDYDVVSDRMEFIDQQITYRFTAGLNGVYRFDLADAEEISGLKLEICDALGAKTAGAGLEDGEGLSARLEAGEAYEIRAAKPERTGEFTLRLGKPSTSEDLTGKNITAGHITYKDQRNVYKYSAGSDGRCLFTIGNLPDDSRVGLDIYDSLGFKIRGEESIGNGGSVSAELEAGQDYEILVTQRSGKGGYTLTVREDE